VGISGVRNKMGPIIPTALTAHHAPKALLILTSYTGYLMKQKREDKFSSLNGGL